MTHCHSAWYLGGMKTRRIQAGQYETQDGRYTIQAIVREEAGGYGPAGEIQWYVGRTGYPADDVYDTKREAVAALDAATTGRYQEREE